MSSTYLPDVSNTARYFDMTKILQLKIAWVLPMLYIANGYETPLLNGESIKGRRYSWKQKACALRFCGGVV